MASPLAHIAPSSNLCHPYETTKPPFSQLPVDTTTARVAEKQFKKNKEALSNFRCFLKEVSCIGLYISVIAASSFVIHFFITQEAQSKGLPSN